MNLVTLFHKKLLVGVEELSTVVELLIVEDTPSARFACYGRKVNVRGSTCANWDSSICINSETLVTFHCTLYVWNEPEMP